MVHELPPHLGVSSCGGDLQVGMYVDVDYEHKEGTCSDGGLAMILAADNESEPKTAKVQYILDKRVEENVEISRMTDRDFNELLEKAAPVLRSATPTKATTNSTYTTTSPTPALSPFQRLSVARNNRSHEKRGWLVREMLQKKELDGTKKSKQEAVVLYHSHQTSARKAVEADRLTRGCTKFAADPRRGQCGSVNGPDNKPVSRKAQSQLDVPKNIYVKEYLEHAFDVNKCTMKRWLKPGGSIKPAKAVGTAAWSVKGNCVIKHREFAKVSPPSSTFRSTLPLRSIVYCLSKILHSVLHVLFSI